MDATKFDFTKFFDPIAAIEQAEKNTKSCTGFITDSTARTATESLTDAGFQFARAQATATQAFGEAIKKVFQI